MNLEHLLLPKGDGLQVGDVRPVENVFRWATVTTVSPLAIQLDGDSQVLPATPDTLAGPYRVGDRVWCQIYGRAVIVLGGAQNSPVQGFMSRAQRLISGGGIRRVTGTPAISLSIGWSNRFILMGLGRVSGLSVDGYFGITVPPDGTVIPIHGTTGAASATVAGGMIPMPYWGALYYQVPLGQTSASVPGNFHIVDYTSTMPYAVPSDWVLIAAGNGDSNLYPTPMVTWADGVRQDAWRVPTLTNSWVNYGSGFEDVAYRVTHEGRIELRGMMKNGLSGNATPAFTLPSNFGPTGTLNSTGQIYMQIAAGNYAQVNVLNGGRVAINGYASGGNNTLVSLQGISWWPDYAG